MADSLQDALKVKPFEPRATAAILGAIPRLQVTTEHFLLPLYDLANDFVWLGDAPMAALPSTAQQSCRAYVRELAAALQDSGCLENYARLLLLAVCAVTACPAAQAARDFLEVLASIVWHTFCLTDACVMAARCSCGGEEAAASALRGALSGRCVRQLLLSLGVAALCEADGGPDYGMTPELRRGLSSTGELGARLRELLRREGWREEHTLAALTYVLATAEGVADPPPGRLAALHLTLRIGRLAVAAARAWEEHDAADLTSQAAAGGAARGAAAVGAAGPASAEAPAASSARSDAPVPPVDPSRLRAAVSKANVRSLVLDARASAKSLAASLPPRSGADRIGAEVEVWRLAADTVRHCCSAAFRGTHAGVAEALKAVASLRTCTRADDAVFAFPPSYLAAALHGGLLGCLELLLRRAITRPSDHYAEILRQAAEWYETDQGKIVDCVLLPAAALMYGKPRDAAALLTSFGKACRLASRVAAALPPAATACRFLLLAPPWLGGLAAAEGAGGQPPSAPVLRLARLVSYLVRRALPSLAKGACHDMAAVRAFAEEDTGVPCVVVLHWLPILAQLTVGCSGTSARPLTLHDDQSAVRKDGRSEAIEAAGHLGGPAAASPLTASCPSAGASTGCGGANAAAAAGDGGNAWRPMLRDLAPQLATLCGHALQFAPRCRAVGDWNAPSLPEVAAACVAVAAACPTEVRAAAAGAAAQAAATRGPAAMGGGGSRRPERNGVGQGVRRGSGAGRLPDWHPQCVRALLPGLRAAGHGAMAAAAEALAAQLERWNRGGGGGTEAADGARLLSLLPESGAVRLLAAAPPTDILCLLCTCANPECENLSGDSEAELRLQACGGCGEVAYCCRECQTAHWRAEHKEACSRRGRTAAQG